MDNDELKKALKTLQGYASLLDKDDKSTSYDKDIDFSKLFSSERKINPYAGFINPIRRSLDYQGIARRLLVVDPMPNSGALLIYDSKVFYLCA